MGKDKTGYCVTTIPTQHQHLRNQKQRDVNGARAIPDTRKTSKVGNHSGPT